MQNNRMEVRICRGKVYCIHKLKHAERAADKSGGMNTPQEKKEDVYEFVDHHAAVQQCKRERKEH